MHIQQNQHGGFYFSEVNNMQINSKIFGVKAANNNKQQVCAKSGGVTLMVFKNRDVFFKQSQECVEVERHCKI